MSRRILATSALPYANGAIHLGHLVEYIQTDIWVRFQRMQGHEVHYVGADDTHGTPIMLRADAEGITPEQLIERVWKEHDRDFKSFGVAFDNFYTTNSPENEALCAEIYGRLKDAGLIVRSSSSTTRSRKCSCPTATSRVNAPNAARRTSTVTPARCVAQPMPRQS